MCVVMVNIHIEKHFSIFELKPRTTLLQPHFVVCNAHTVTHFHILRLRSESPQVIFMVVVKIIHVGYYLWKTLFEKKKILSDYENTPIALTYLNLSYMLKIIRYLAADCFFLDS